MEATKAERRQRNMEALGLGPRRERKARHATHTATSDPIAQALSKDATQR